VVFTVMDMGVEKVTFCQPLEVSAVNVACPSLVPSRI